MNTSEADLGRTVADANRLSELLTEAKATVKSQDHTVTVTVVPGNAVTAIELDHQARRHTGDELAELILETINAANAQLAADLTEAARDLGPEAQNAVAMVQGRMEPIGGGSLITEPSELDELAAGMDEADVWEDFTAEERDFMRRNGWEDELLAAQERLKELREDADRQLAAYAEIQERIAGRSVTATSPDGGVEVTVKHGSGVTRLQIHDEALRRGASKVGPSVLSTIQQANAQLALGIAGSAHEYAGSRMNVRDLVGRYQPADDEPDGSSSGKW